MPPPSEFKGLYAIGRQGTISKMDAGELDDDPRGILFLMEPPSKRFKYVMGIDPTQGITGWSRYSRHKADLRTNNGAIEVIRAGYTVEKAGLRLRLPDIQVAEFAAPLDPEELGNVANLIGRIYAGEEEDQCECIIETYPGPGGLTMRQMAALGYTNFWKWQYYADLIPGEKKNAVGWTATQKTLRDLWVKCSRHLCRKEAKIYSPWLVEEYADARLDETRGYAVSPNNDQGHGDRLRAFNLCLWASNRWEMDIERTYEQVSGSVIQPDWQQTDLSDAEIEDRMGAVWDRLWEQ
jgi:hypothetical protein